MTANRATGSNVRTGTLPNLGELLNTYCDKIEEVQTWGGNVVFSDDIRKQVARLHRLVDPPSDGSRQDAMPITAGRDVSLAQALDHLRGTPVGPDGVQVIHRPGGRNVAGDPIEQVGAGEGTSRLLLRVFSPTETFTTADAIERLAEEGHTVSRNAVATALSRWEGRFFERVGHGIYKVLPQSDETTPAQASRDEEAADD